jgi:DNA end-binding protein Ku
MRAIWSGEISFGLVTIPVKLFSATRDLTPKFHLLHKVCGTRVQMVRRCPKCERDVSWDEIEKGYEVEKGEYARFAKEELAEASEDEERGIAEIVEFVDPLEVDLAFIDKSYWVAPSGKNARSYLLLRAVLEKTGKVGVAKIALRSRTRLALIRPREGRFSLDMMRFADELTSGKDVPVAEAKAPTDRELGLAKTLVAQLSGPFQPEKHPDEYRAKVAALVEEKVEAHHVAKDTTTGARARHAEGGKVIDLSDLLARSLEKKRGPSVAKARGRKGEAAPKPHRPAKRHAG